MNPDSKDWILATTPHGPGGGGKISDQICEAPPQPRLWGWRVRVGALGLLRGTPIVGGPIISEMRMHAEKTQVYTVPTRS